MSDEKCPAALGIKGEVHLCDQPRGHGVTAPGFPVHSNADAEAIWQGDPAPDPRFVEVITGSVEDCCGCRCAGCAGGSDE